MPTNHQVIPPLQQPFGLARPQVPRNPELCSLQRWQGPQENEAREGKRKRKARRGEGPCWHCSCCPPSQGAGGEHCALLLFGLRSRHLQASFQTASRRRRWCSPFCSARSRAASRPGSSPSRPAHAGSLELRGSNHKFIMLEGAASLLALPNVISPHCNVVRIRSILKIG